ncbi:hypothetical protein BDV93DRAFT_525361 [Ceratobasidium sp. AG-I]|nr:hypothetical protein BDV93DRAFT_525361 [Ceratobasidium sp. AG-I]
MPTGSLNAPAPGLVPYPPSPGGAMSPAQAADSMYPASSGLRNARGKDGYAG